MTTQNPDSPAPVPTPKPVPARRSEALEVELAMLEAMLPKEAEGSGQPAPVDAPAERGGTR